MVRSLLIARSLWYMNHIWKLSCSWKAHNHFLIIHRVAYYFVVEFVWVGLISVEIKRIRRKAYDKWGFTFYPKQWNKCFNYFISFTNKSSSFIIHQKGLQFIQISREKSIIKILIQTHSSKQSINQASGNQTLMTLQNSVQCHNTFIVSLLQCQTPLKHSHFNQLIFT